jgi:two-component system CheB/CheR fusion protein
LTALTGYTAADIPTRDEWENLAYRENAREVRETLRIALESNTALDRPEISVYTKSGEKRVWSVRTAPAGRDASGQRMLVSVALDITERKRSAEEAHASRSKLEAALAAMTEAVFICDTKGCFIHFNDAFAKFHKFKSKEDCAKTFNEYPAFLDFFWPGGDRVPWEEWPSQRALRGETGMLSEYVMKRRGGETYVGSYNFAPIRDESGEITAAVITARDVTNQKRAENRLRESEARLSSIIDTAADSIIVLDEKGIIQSANPATLGTLGYSPQELAGQHIGILMSPDVKAKHDGYFAGFVGRDILKEVEARRKNGSTIPLDVAVAEWRDGEGRRFFTGVLRDLSERKYNEEVLANARRLEAVGQLAGGVAHDFNNLLAVIAGNLELAEDRITDEKTNGLIRRALDAAEKGSGLNRRLLSLARKRMLKPQRLTLNSRVEETAKLLTSILGEHVAVSTNLASDPWVTVADPGEIDSAILNIAANARDAMPNGGWITIATSNVTLDARMAAALHRDARPGDYVCLAIADNGVGMPEEVLRKAMEPFFTTKGQGAGTGLGLTSVASFARQTGGFATVKSSPGRGCAVRLFLPRSIEKLAPREAKPKEVPLGNGELILVVEDNDQVREVTLKRIESLGYAVAEARSGLEALQRLQSKDPVELVLSDIVMPGGMSGYDVARWLASNMPEIKVILCSGYSEGDLRGDTQGAIRDATVLGKPYTREQLAWALRNGLAAVHRAEETSKYPPSIA